LKQSAGRLFIRGFVQSFFIVVILLGAGILGFRLTKYFLELPGEEAIVAYQGETVPESITVATIDDISKNLIYCYDEDTNEIIKIILEVFHCEDKKLTYITIPIRTRLTISDALYQDLVLVQPAIPQVMHLSSMVNYYDSETVLEYGVLIIEDLLDIDISYYTAIPQTTYDMIFTEKTIIPEESSAFSDIATTKETIQVEAFREEYMEFLKTIQTEEELSTYIEQIYPSFQSNLSVAQKMNYLESYCLTPLKNIFFDIIRGNDSNSAYMIDHELVKQQLRELSADGAKE
jgi:hypothetical protein